MVMEEGVVEVNTSCGDHGGSGEGKEWCLAEVEWTQCMTGDCG